MWVVSSVLVIFRKHIPQGKHEIYLSLFIIYQPLETPLGYLSKKILIKKTQFPCWPIPSLNTARPMWEWQAKWPRKDSVPSQNFLRKFREKC
jgi:hypothetical protein